MDRAGTREGAMTAVKRLIRLGLLAAQGQNSVTQKPTLQANQGLSTNYLQILL